MNLELKDKRVLVTGSSRGIGFAIASLFHQEGCHVMLNGRQPDDLSDAAQKLPGSCFALGDVSQPAEAGKIISETLRQLGQLDVLICNVGDGRSALSGEETYNDWQKVFSQNLWSTTNIVEAARPSLIASKGVIVCVSSICGLDVIEHAPLTYSVAKAALNAYVRGISHPFGKLGVRINAVAPGNILFDGSVWSKKIVQNPDEVKAMLERDVALEELGTPEDVANLVVYLASSRAKFVTGSVWVLDGGQTHQ